MPFEVVSGVGREMGVLDGVVIVEGDGAVLGLIRGEGRMPLGAAMHSSQISFGRTCLTPRFLVCVSLFFQLLAISLLTLGLLGCIIFTGFVSVCPVFVSNFNAVIIDRYCPDAASVLFIPLSVGRNTCYI